MKSFSLILAALCGTIFVSGPSAQTSRTSASLIRAGANAPRERKFEFEYKALVKEIPAGAKKVDLWIPVPHDSPFQTITGDED